MHKGKTSVYAICCVAGSLLILSTQHAQFDSYFFQANEETLMIRNSTEQIAETKDTTVMYSNCSQINQSTGMYCQSNIGKFPAYLIGLSLILYLP